MEQGSNGFLASLPPELRKQVQGQMRILRAKRGQSLLGRGAGSTDVYFVLEGSFNVIVYSASGREVSLRALTEGDTFGELAAVDGLPRSATVVAQRDARVAALRREEFLAAIRASPDTALWLARLLTAKVRDMNERLFELSALNVQARLHCELLRIAKAAKLSPDGRREAAGAPTHLELANRIGTHREAVTREMGALAERGIIEVERRRLTFPDLSRLELLVGQAVGDLLELPPVR